MHSIAHGYMVHNKMNVRSHKDFQNHLTTIQEKWEVKRFGNIKFNERVLNETSIRIKSPLLETFIPIFLFFVLGTCTAKEIISKEKSLFWVEN